MAAVSPSSPINRTSGASFASWPRRVSRAVRSTLVTKSVRLLGTTVWTAEGAVGGTPALTDGLPHLSGQGVGQDPHAVASLVRMET